jgi:TusA-related sulfurtransferase
LIDGTKIRNSYYTNYFKWICVCLVISTAAAFRGLASILDMQRHCNILQVIKTPSHTSIRRWINQVGYYNLQKPQEKANDWVYFIDNSMRIENRKVCLILGARLSKLKKGKYLTYEDLEPLEIRIIKQNNELEVIIEDAIAKTGIPRQICSDSGPDVMASIRKIKTKYQKIKHIPDIMHKTGHMLKKRLENDKRWKSFITLLNESKKRLCLSSLSFICPPNLRGKSRFLNCQNVVEWTNRALVVLEEMQKADPNWQEMNEKLGWLVDYKQDIAMFTELFGLAGLSKEIVRKLHIDKHMWLAAEELLGEDVKSIEGKLFAKDIVDFLKEQCEKAEEGMLLVGSSEIIESAFSKLKLLDRECGNSGFTLSVLGLAACFGATDYKSVAKAFEECNYKDVVAWGKKHVGETIQKKRRRILTFQKREDLSLKLTRFLTKEIMAA